MTSLHIIGDPSPTFFQEGIYDYGDNSGMHSFVGKQPDIHLLMQEYAHFKQVLDQLGVPYAPKPASLDAMVVGRHDEVFAKDVGVSHVGLDNKPHIFWSTFAKNVAASRGEEVKTMQRYVHCLLETLAEEVPMKYHQVPQAFEGGEQNTVMDSNGLPLILYGTGRASQAGQQFILNKIRSKDTCHVQAAAKDAYHVDTITATMTGVILACRDVIDVFSFQALHRFCGRNGMNLIEIDPIDSIGNPDDEGRRKNGTFACNGVEIAPHKFVSGHAFQTPGITDELRRHGIEHIVTPTTQLGMSGGSVNCNRLQLNGIDPHRFNVELANKGFVIQQARLALQRLRAEVLLSKEQRSPKIHQQLGYLTPAILKQYMTQHDLRDTQFYETFCALRERIIDQS